MKTKKNLLGLLATLLILFFACDSATNQTEDTQNVKTDTYLILKSILNKSTPKQIEIKLYLMNSIEIHEKNIRSYLLVSILYFRILCTEYHLE